MKYSMYIGGYGMASITRVILRDGRLKRGVSYDAVNASWLTLSPDGRRLYAVGETQRFRAYAGGSVQSYEIGEKGALTQTAIQPTLGMDPCHLLLTDEMLIASNYTSGTVSRFRLTPQGDVGEALPLIELQGSGPDPERQAGPHAHQAQRAGDWYALSDLGSDTVWFVPADQIAADKPELHPVRVPAGFGPRHCVFPQGSRTWYVVCELKSELLIYRGFAEEAELVGRVSVGGGAADNYPAALRLSPDGSMLAATGRGKNIVSLYALSANGLPALLTEVDSMGDWPRDVQFTPDGKYIICANQNSGSLAAFRLEGGRLEYASSLALPQPSCILFAEEPPEVAK